jgi:hypothetical protein
MGDSTITQQDVYNLFNEDPSFHTEDKHYDYRNTGKLTGNAATAYQNIADSRGSQVSDPALLAAERFFTKLLGGADGWQQNVLNPGGVFGKNGTTNQLTDESLSTMTGHFADYISNVQQGNYDGAKAALKNIVDYAGQRGYLNSSSGNQEKINEVIMDTNNSIGFTPDLAIKNGFKMGYTSADLDAYNKQNPNAQVAPGSLQGGPTKMIDRWDDRQGML